MGTGGGAVARARGVDAGVCGGRDFARAATSPAPTTSPAPVSAKDDEGPPRLSLPTESDRDAWLRGGFRLSLGLVYGRLVGLEGAPSGRLLGATVRLGLRLDASWSVLASFQYASASAARRPVGPPVRGHDRSDVARHAAPRARARPRLRRHRRGAHRAGPTSTRSPTPSRRRTRSPAPHRRCRAAAASARPALARAEWTFVLGPRTATSLGLEARRSVDGLRGRYRARRARHGAGDRARASTGRTSGPPARGASRGAEARADAGVRLLAGRDPGAACSARARRRARRPPPTQARPTQASTRAPPTALRTPGRALPAAADGGADARAVFEPPRGLDRHAGPLPGRRAPDPRAGVGDGQAAGRHDGHGDEGGAADAAGAPVRRGGDDGGARLSLRTGSLRRQARLRRDHVHATVPAPRADPPAPAAPGAPQGPRPHRHAARAPRRARHATPARDRHRHGDRGRPGLLDRIRRQRALSLAAAARPRARVGLRVGAQRLRPAGDAGRPARAGGDLPGRARTLQPSTRPSSIAPRQRDEVSRITLRGRRDPEECRARSGIRSG